MVLFFVFELFFFYLCSLSKTAGCVFCTHHTPQNYTVGGRKRSCDLCRPRGLQSRGLQEEGEVLTLPLLARESPQSAGSVRLLDFFSSWSPASSMMGSSLVCTHSE